ncbi:MAG: hypothetical protein ACERLG_10400, partial [Sedimentibacter sp.]
IKKITDEKIIDYKVYDLDGDENEELLVLTKSHNNQAFGKDLIIFKTNAIKEKLEVSEIYREDFSEIKPWKVDACNLDNDGQADIFIGVYKDTLFYKDYRKRPFFYSWDGENLNKKWLGSFFSQWDLVDITFGDFFNLGYDTVAILEKNEIKEYRVVIYNFIGFGFECMKSTGNYRNVKKIETEKENNKYFIVLKLNSLKNRVELNFD